jgi:diguanylate cyclase (GGDEF)-like protein
MLIKLLSLYLFIAILFLSFLFVYSFVRGKSNHARVMGLLSLCLQIYLLGYLLEINTNLLSEMMFWNQIQYFGIPFFPALWLVISLLYTGRIDYIKGYRLIIIFIIPILTFIIRITNNVHFLYYKTLEIQTIGEFSSLYLTKGPWYLVQMIYVLITLVLCTYFYYQRYRKSSGNERMQFSLLLYASVLPYLALILVFINWGGTGIDYTAIILPPCILLINLALTKYNFLDIKNLARERVFEDSSLGFILLNRTSRVVDYNNQSKYIFNLLNIQLKETSLEKILIDHDDILECIRSSSQVIAHRIIDHKDKYISINVKEIKNKEEIIGQLVTLEDVTEKERLRYRLLEMANTDVLSGLNNRRKFRESAEEVILRAQRYDQIVSLLMMDIDFFKRINDAYGHAAGDEVIKVFSDLLRENFRSSDIIGRMGGEEFAVVLINCDKNTAFEKAEQFRFNVESYPFIVDDQTIQINVSIGVSELNESANSLDHLINQADHALYQAKEKGRNQTVIF